MSRKTSILIAALVACCSCISTKDVSGVYRSNFAKYGFFTTKINFKSDSTFGYRMRGDLLSDTAKGIYKVARKRLMLNYDKPVLENRGYMKLGRNDSVMFQAEIISDRGPKIYYIGHRKLFVADSLGHREPSAVGYSRHKKFLFWGECYLLKRRYFLKKIN